MLTEEAYDEASSLPMLIGYLSYAGTAAQLITAETGTRNSSDLWTLTVTRYSSMKFLAYP